MVSAAVVNVVTGPGLARGCAKQATRTEPPGRWRQKADHDPSDEKRNNGKYLPTFSDLYGVDFDVITEEQGPCGASQDS